MGSKPMRQPGLLPPGGLRRCVRLLDSVSQGLPLASWQVKASRSELEHGQEMSDMSVVSTYNSQHTLQKS